MHPEQVLSHGSQLPFRAFLNSPAPQVLTQDVPESKNPEAQVKQLVESPLEQVKQAELQAEHFPTLR